MNRTFHFLLACALGLFAGCGPRSMTQPALPSNASLSMVLEVSWNEQQVVVPIPKTDLTRLASAPLSQDEWNSILAVYAQDEPPSKGIKVPPITGKYVADFDNETLVFFPRYPLVPGVTYWAVFAGASQSKADPREHMIELKKAETAPTAVEQIFPTADVLPENVLRFYLHFSAPMSRGEAYEHIKLLDSAGKPIPAAFLELGEELWDGSGQRFTLLVDPGRIKQGLKPREDLGPVFENGKSYTLVVGNGWHDANGNPLEQTHRKAFTIGPPNEKTVEPKLWKLVPPKAETKDALLVTFPVPLDHALLHRLLWVADADGQRRSGLIKVALAETRWHWTPADAWKPGTYRLVADTRLEDQCGNNLAALFEVDVFKPIQRALQGKTVEVGFRVE